MNQTDTFSTQQGNSAPTSPAGRAGQEDSADTVFRNTAEKARRAAGKVASQAKEKVAQVAGEQQGAAADKLGGYSSRLRNTARAVGEEDPNIAYFANQAADRLESVADYVRTTDLGRLKQDAAGIARRHPALVMGGLLVAGLILGSVAKAAVESLRESEPDDGEDLEEPYPNGHDSPAATGEQSEFAGESADPVGGDFPAANQTSSPATP